MAKVTPKKKASRKSKKKTKSKTPSYPRYSLDKVLRIPKGILEQNAGKECTDEQSASYIGVKYNRGPYFVEINSGIRYGLLERSEPGKLKLTDIARKILKPQEKGQDIFWVCKRLYSKHQ